MAYTQQQMGYGQSLFPQYDVTDEETAANAQPFTQTIKIDPATGRQTMTLKGAPEDFTAANPYTPTVMGPVMPEAAPVQVASLNPYAGLSAPAVPQQPAYNIPSNMQESVFNPAAATPMPAVPQQAQQPMDYAGRMPEEIAQQMMPGEQVFAQTTTANAAPQTQQLFATEFDTAKTDPIKLLTLSKDEGRFTPEQRNLFRSEAQTLMARDLRQRQIEREVRQEYEQATQTGNFSNLSKMLASKDDQGSFAKMILLGFISPELAGLEAKKLGLADQTQVSQITDANGKTRDVIVKVRNGVPISGYDSNENPLSPQDLLRVSSGQGVKTDLVGGTYVSDTEKDQFGRPLVGTVVRKTYKDGRVESFVQTDEGRKPMAGFRPQSSTGSLEMQNVAQLQKLNNELRAKWEEGKARVQIQGPAAYNQWLGEFQAKHPDIPVTFQSLQGPAPQIDIASGRLISGVTAPAAGQVTAQGAVAPAQTAAAETAPAELNVKRPQAQASAAPAPAQTPAAPAAVAPGPVSPAAPGVARPAGKTPAQVLQQEALGLEAGKSQIQVSEAKEKEYQTKFLPALNEKASQASDVVQFRRQLNQLMFDNPQVVGYLSGEGSTSQELRNIIRDIYSPGGQDKEEISRRIANLRFDDTPDGRAAKNAVYEINNIIRNIAPTTLKAVAGAGSVSDAEQKANRETIGDPSRLPLFGALSANSRDMFRKSLSIAERDWASQQNLRSEADHGAKWAQQKTKLDQDYMTIYKARNEYISKHGNTAQAVAAGFKLYPEPTYSSDSGWSYGGSSQQLLNQRRQRPDLSNFNR